MIESYGSFSTFAATATKPAKHRNGDSFIVRVINEDMVLLAVADGVSTCPCDWMASKVACQTVAESFANRNGTISDRIKYAAAEANDEVRAITGNCAGSITSLSLAVWEIRNNKTYIVNVGDSRIYLGSESDLQQKTTDDVARVVMKRDGNVLLNAGIPVFKRGVTRSLGQFEPLEFEVATHELDESDLIVLVSDGITKNDAFTVEFEKIFSGENIEEDLTALVRDNAQRNDDDATLIAVWRNETITSSHEIYEYCIAEQKAFRNLGLSSQAMMNFLKTRILEHAKMGSTEAVTMALNYAERFGIKFGRAFWIDVLSIVLRTAEDRALIFRIREMIRKSKS